MIWPYRVIVSTCAVLIFASSGCIEPATGVDVIQPGTEPPGGLFGADGGMGSCGTADPSPLSKLHISVLTSAFGGRYRPRNVGAIWVETAAGAFVKTIDRWGASRARYIVKWQASSHANVVDAVTGATLQSHITHDRTWNLKDLTECEVPSGDYRIMMETTDYDGAGASTMIPFTKGQTPLTLTPADTTNFHSIKIELQ